MLEQVFLHQKQYSLKLRHEPLEIRLEHLKTLEIMLDSHQRDFVEALQKDFGKPEMESLVTEIYPLLIEIRHAQKNLAKWMEPTKVAAPLFLTGTQNEIYYEPRGVCLIISPWNYPLFLSISPLISAIAAGNTAFLKPSELTPNTSGLLAKLLKASFAEEHITVVEGGADTAQELLKLPFDHIFFTGSTAVGKIVMEAASKNLSSVTLELGGKSPTIVDNTADLEVTAQKILWAKFVNAGQTCVAPDYLFVQDSIYGKFLHILKKQAEEIYGKSPEDRKGNKDFARIISNRHIQRLNDLLEEAKTQGAQVAYGGDVDLTERFMAPTFLENVDLHSRIMKEEIFGPLLPVIKFKELSEAIHFVNERPKPLSLYLYSHSEMDIEMVKSQTSSGGLVVNDSIVHLGNPYLPFGGIGESGIGNSHGIHGFHSFSHAKAVLRQGWTGKMLRLMYPPYNKQKLDVIKGMIRWRV